MNIIVTFNISVDSKSKGRFCVEVENYDNSSQAYCIKIKGKTTVMFN